MGWCPAGPVLVGHPSSDGVTIKILYGVDFLQLFLLGWLKLNLALLDQLRLG